MKCSKAVVMGVLGMFLACGAGEALSAEPFVGTWKKVGGRGPESEVIERHGDLFVIKAPRLMMPGETDETPAKLRDGALVVNDGVEARSFYVDPANGHLLTGHGEYVRVK